MEYIQGNKGVFTITCEPGKQYRVLTASSESLPFEKGQPVILRPLNSNYSPFPYDYQWQSNELILSLNYNTEHIALETIKNDTEKFFGTMEQFYIKAENVTSVMVSGYQENGVLDGQQLLAVLVRTPTINGIVCKTNPATIKEGIQYSVCAVNNKNGVEFTTNQIKCTIEDGRMVFTIPPIVIGYR